tara:strand:- start:1488 stop:1751 length:264 start_codon:yes stop_codon:yes gene_type:complete
MNRQQAKEAATFLAIRQGFALVRRELEIHAVSAMGNTHLISRSHTKDNLWHDAYGKLLEKGGGIKNISKANIDPLELPQKGWLPVSK